MPAPPCPARPAGPLIRIIGDRFPSPIKAAILGTLGLLIAKAGAGLKPFVPQLQTTFLKCLNDQADVGAGTRTTARVPLRLVAHSMPLALSCRLLAAIPSHALATSP